MTSRSPFSARAIRLLCTLCILSLVPSTAWLQEQAAAQQQGNPAEPAPSQPTAPAAPSTPSAEQSSTYVIRQGDTLWDIANAAYRDPFLWPLIWKSNPSINDPDLIYPGNKLVIPSLAPVERAMSAPEESAPVQEKAESAAPALALQPEETAYRQRPAEPEADVATTAPGHTLIVPEDTARPIIDKYAMISAGFVSEETSKDYLQGAVEDPTRGIQGSSIVGFDHEVYLVVQSREEVGIGERFVIFEELHDVRHPVTGEKFGKLYKVNGIAKVTGVKEKNVYVARITLSFDAARRGNFLVPYQEPTLIFPSKEHRTKDLAGYIIDVTDRRSISGQADYVFLDKGKDDGVEPGDRFTVLSEPHPSTGIRRPIGEVQVFLVKSRTATAIVRKSIDTMSKGYAVVYKN